MSLFLDVGSADGHNRQSTFWKKILNEDTDRYSGYRQVFRIQTGIQDTDRYSGYRQVFGIQTGIRDTDRKQLDMLDGLLVLFVCSACPLLFWIIFGYILSNTPR